MVLKNFATILFLISFCYEFLNSKIRVLNYIANNSFPIYFLHVWVLSLMGFLFEFELTSFTEVFIVFLVVTLMSLLLIIIAKRIFKSHAKYLIGT